MLKTLLKPFTTATASGTAVRYITIMLTTALTVVGFLGWLDADQVKSLTDSVPGLANAAAGLLLAVMTVYGVITKSSSDKAAEAAKQIDAQIPVSSPVVIETPGSAPNIVVPAKP